MLRRDFLQKSAFATAGTMLIPHFLKAFETNQLGHAQQAGALTTDATNGKILVVVQLSGGNDGLNTEIGRAHV